MKTLKQLVFGKQANIGQRHPSYHGSTQQWLPVDDVRDGIVCLKDGRYIKILEVLPLDIRKKSEAEKETIIYYFSCYLKIAPSSLQIRTLTQRADISGYIRRREHLAKSETNPQCIAMLQASNAFLHNLTYRLAIRRRYFLVLPFEPSIIGREYRFEEIRSALETEADKARKYLANCGLTIIRPTDDNAAAIDALCICINADAAILPGDMTAGVIGGKES